MHAQILKFLKFSPLFLFYLSGKQLFVRKEWRPLSEKFVLILLVVVTLDCLTRGHLPLFFDPSRWLYPHSIKQPYGSGELGPLPILQREKLNLSELIKEVSLSSCPGIVLGMTLTLFWPIICERKPARELLGKVSSEIKRADGRKCYSSCCMPLCLQAKAGTSLANMWPQMESIMSNMVA